MQAGLDIEEFRRDIYTIVRMVPRGRATSYGAIACALGRPGHSRLVGFLMARCSAEGIPAHRVVSSTGVLTGSCAFGRPGTMERLLEEEGVTVEGGRIKRWKQIFWNPVNEIGI